MPDQVTRLGPTRRGRTERRIYHPLPLDLPRLNNVRRRGHRGLNARYGPLEKLKRGGKTLRTIPTLVGIQKWSVQPKSLQPKNGSQADTIQRGSLWPRPGSSYTGHGGARLRICHRRRTVPRVPEQPLVGLGRGPVDSGDMALVASSLARQPPR